MTKVSYSAHFKASPKHAFAVFTELETAPDRIEAIQEIEILTDGPIGAGTTWRETRLMYGRNATEEMTIDTFDPPSGYTVKAHNHGTDYHTSFTFVPEKDGTVVTMTFEGKPCTFFAKMMSFMGILMKGSLLKLITSEVEALRKFAEERAAAEKENGGSAQEA